MSPSLRELQQAFWRSLQGAPDPALVPLVVPTARLDAAAHVRLYADMYFWRLRDVLRADYPRLVAVLGDAAFAALARAYLAAHPSDRPSVRDLGRHLPAFLAASPPPGTPPFLADLARLEWARGEVFDAPDAAPLALDALRAVPPAEWPALRFAPVPAFVMLVAAWPVDALWDAPEANRVRAERTALRVWRRGFDVYHARMDAAEEAALARLVAGEPFAGICEPCERAEDAAALLLRWLDDGLLAAAPPVY
ncbi:MAG TPA: putative DNA-binding domain-containing protein [Candidatus Binatia bacterium]|jgi:hypothetical protein|nr:putative DNA-binding domain-containing protein [Candidatus Binatia bacterium]